MIFKKGFKKFKSIESSISKKLTIKKNPLNFIDETKDKLKKYYSNLEKQREKDKKKAERKKTLEEKKK